MLGLCCLLLQGSRLHLRGGLLATSLLEFQGNFCSWDSRSPLQASCKVIFELWSKATSGHRVQVNYSSCSEFKDTFLRGIRDSEDCSRRSRVGDLWLRAAKLLVALTESVQGGVCFLKPQNLIASAPPVDEGGASCLGVRSS